MEDDSSVEGTIDSSGSSISGTWLVLLAVIPVAVVSMLVLLHFQFGVNIPFLRVFNPESATYWGQIGDFVGGVLNPVLSFIALLAVVLSLRSQASELRAARAEARAAQSTQIKQTQIFKEQSQLIERQSFETVFFGLLQLKERNVETAKYYHNGNEAIGLSAFETYSRKYNVDKMPLVEGVSDNHETNVLERAEYFYEVSDAGLGRYFRTLFELIFYIDNYGVSRRRSPLELKLDDSAWSDPSDDVLKKTYAAIVAASLSLDESECVMMYCLSSKGKELKFLCEKYGLLRHVPKRNNQDYMKALFNSSAFK